MTNDSNNTDTEATVQSNQEVSPVELPPIEEPSPEEQAKATNDVNMNMIMDVPVDIHVEIGSTRLSIREILRMGTGSIIELNRLAGAPADILVNGKLIGNGDIVVVNDNFGIRIGKLVDPEQRIESL